MAKTSTKYILFRAKDKDFALPFDASVKIVNLGDWTPLPIKNQKILGLAYHEGNIVTVINLVASQSHDKACLLFNFKDDFYGLLISEAKQVMSIAKQDLKKYNILTIPDIIHTLAIYD